MLLAAVVIGTREFSRAFLRERRFTLSSDWLIKLSFAVVSVVEHSLSI